MMTTFFMVPNNTDYVTLGKLLSVSITSVPVSVYKMRTRIVPG